MATPPPTSAEPVQTNRTWVMTVLVAVYASNFIDRTIINVLQQPIKVELGLQDWQLGMLGGTTFAIFYTVLGLYVARIAERSDRTTVLTICILLWSAFTMLCGAVTGFVQLLLLRVGVAVGEAGATPTGHSLISDCYPPEKRAGALAVFASGNTIGAMLGALLGGVVGHAWGWRWAFVVAGAPGVILALLTWFTIREPRRARPRETARETDVPPARAVAATLFAKPTFRHLAAAVALTLFAAYAISAFFVPHLMRSFGLSLQAAGLYGGVGGGLMLGIGTILGGFLAQRLARRDRRWMLWTPGTAMALAAPLCLATFTARDMDAAIALFLVMSIGIGTFQGPLFGTTHSFIGPRMRATASAIMLLTITLIGLGLGPLVIGFASDLLAQRSYGAADYETVCRAGTIAIAACQAASAEGLRLALRACGGVFAWSAVHFFLAARTIRDDVID